MKVVLEVDNDEYIEVVASKENIDRMMDQRLAEAGYDANDVITMRVIEDE